uniref:ATP synthase F0 subunit 8 n=1 Tax=Endeis sp. JZ-2022 TaxID=2992007 RepID=A0A9E7V7B3_9CHEL|nr:ATP synthase F0 subunit 8 [Endeis sp. JZ-2022]
MPQMMPMNWTLIMLMTSVAMLMTMMIMHNFNLKSNLSSTLNPSNKKIMKNMEW